jgi:hypothetical protein
MTSLPIMPNNGHYPFGGQTQVAPAPEGEVKT